MTADQLEGIPAEYLNSDGTGVVAQTEQVQLQQETVLDALLGDPIMLAMILAAAGFVIMIILFFKMRKRSKVKVKSQAMLIKEAAQKEAKEQRKKRKEKATEESSKIKRPSGVPITEVKKPLDPPKKKEKPKRQKKEKTGPLVITKPVETVDETFGSDLLNEADLNNELFSGDDSFFDDLGDDFDELMSESELNSLNDIMATELEPENTFTPSADGVEIADERNEPDEEPESNTYFDELAYEEPEEKPAEEATEEVTEEVTEEPTEEVTEEVTEETLFSHPALNCDQVSEFENSKGIDLGVEKMTVNSKKSDLAEGVRFATGDCVSIAFDTKFDLDYETTVNAEVVNTDVHNIAATLTQRMDLGSMQKGIIVSFESLRNVDVAELKAKVDIDFSEIIAGKITMNVKILVA